ncbi:MAG: triose-phosphate isomerase [Candidatus Eremiobacteraeota bacterium]|nr:triose-phosphate isomerase [Candidatus Eremiobacteraeota bacterium]
MKMQTMVVGNWKMHKTTHEAALFVDEFLGLLPSIPDEVEIVLCPPFTALADVSERVRGTRVALGAQNMHWLDQGAYTGEISPVMLADLGVSYVILGHSERRQFFGETDANINLKVRAALTHGITPVIAVGESLAERDAGMTRDRVARQSRAALAGLASDAVSKVVMAYEPVWSIGTGKNCDPHCAGEVMAQIRSSVKGLEHVPILYGGSVKPENLQTYLANPDCQGGLVGGASLDPGSFAQLAGA